MVLLAPFPLDARVWQRVLPHLKEIRVLTVDPPGFSGADADSEPSLEAYAEALLDALDAASIDRFVVAGNSMGGYVALALADLYPTRVAGIGLIGTKAAADEDEARQKRLDGAEKAESGDDIAELVAPMHEGLLSPATREEDAEAVAALKQWLAEASPTGFAWGQRAMAARPDRLAVLRDMDTPGVVIHGEDDGMMGAESQQPMADALGVDVTSVPSAGHLVPLEAPEVVAETLIGLWRRAARG